MKANVDAAMTINQEAMEATEEKTEGNQKRMDDIKKKMEAAIITIWSKMEETIIRQVEKILLRINH